MTRRASAADWPQMWPLLTGMGTKSSEDELRPLFRELVEDDRWLIVVVEVDGQVTGYAAAQDHGPHLRAPFTGRVARLHDMFVAEPHRREGIGGLLMQAVEAWTSGRVSYLQWQAHAQKAAPFYERLGYHGDPCPQPEYPEFEVHYGSATTSA